MAIDLKDAWCEVAGDDLSERLQTAQVFARYRDADEPIDWQLSGDGVYADPDSGLEAKVTTERVGAALVVRTVVTNRGDNPTRPLDKLHTLALTFDDLHGAQVRQVGGGLTDGSYPPDAYRLRDHVLQTQHVNLAWSHGHDGRSSNRDMPMVMLLVGNHGVVSALEWSSLWYQQLCRLQPSTLIAGVPVQGLVLEPGEELALPPHHLIFFSGDLDDGGNAMRRYFYEQVAPTLAGQRPLPPISYDHWFGLCHEYDEPLLRRQVRRCAQLGLDYFVVDAAWYAGAETSFTQGLGNWRRVHQGRFPDGLEPLAELVREQGMKFGLWFEPERVSRDSDLHREHPDWCLDIGKPHLHLNLAIPAAQTWLIELISEWIERLDLRWSRWDYNIGPLPYFAQADPTGKLLFRYQAGLERVLDTLIQRYPDWCVEVCASGGRRLDLATLRRGHTAWFSDESVDPQLCRIMQTGANRLLPGNFANSSVAVARAAGDAGLTDADVISRMCGALALNGDLASWSARLTRRVGHLIAGYRGFRHLLVQRYYPLTPQPRNGADWEVVSFVSEAGDEAVVLAYRFGGDCARQRLPLRGLNPAASYRVTDCFGRGQPRQVSGATLLERGLSLSLQPAGARVLHLQS